MNSKGITSLMSASWYYHLDLANKRIEKDCIVPSTLELIPLSIYSFKFESFPDNLLPLIKTSNPKGREMNNTINYFELY